MNRGICLLTGFCLSFLITLTGCHTRDLSIPGQMRELATSAKLDPESPRVYTGDVFIVVSMTTVIEGTPLGRVLVERKTRDGHGNVIFVAIVGKDDVYRMGQEVELVMVHDALHLLADVRYFTIRVADHG